MTVFGERLGDLVVVEHLLQSVVHWTLPDRFRRYVPHGAAFRRTMSPVRLTFPPRASRSYRDGALELLRRDPFARPWQSIDDDLAVTNDCFQRLLGSRQQTKIR